MSKAMYEYTKSILERGFDPLLFCKELEKANFTSYEMEQLRVVTISQLKDQS
jgi:hypothetical protein